MSGAAQRPKTRLFVDADLSAGAVVEPREDQAHYLAHVLRLGAGATVAAFNGRDGEWRATIERQGKKVLLRAVDPLRPQETTPELWLIFAPIKRARIDLVAEKAGELGVSILQPVLTERTDMERVNTARLAAHAAEAAEQCGRLSVPEVRAPVTLGALFDGWRGPPIWLAAPDAPAARSATMAKGVLIGPEGGFAPSELNWLSRLPFIVPIGLGPRILRAETAAIVALTLLQAEYGDLAQGLHIHPSSTN